MRRRMCVVIPKHASHQQCVTAVPLGGNTLKCPEECLCQPTALFGVFEELLALKYIVFVVARLLLFEAGEHASHF